MSTDPDSPWGRPDPTGGTATGRPADPAPTPAPPESPTAGYPGPPPMMPAPAHWRPPWVTPPPPPRQLPAQNHPALDEQEQRASRLTMLMAVAAAVITLALFCVWGATLVG
ncbi:hypothetical protein [Pilimelia columellifera]|uniref:Uncharacterized protein n=1 Tax=Pilimelia columellifera subsp. columellifera TaxID=706583 RepID=A0ABP6AQY1_9ACTN